MTTLRQNLDSSQARGKQDADVVAGLEMRLAAQERRLKTAVDHIDKLTKQNAGLTEGNDRLIAQLQQKSAELEETYQEWSKEKTEWTAKEKGLALPWVQATATPSELEAVKQQVHKYQRELEDLEQRHKMLNLQYNEQLDKNRQMFTEIQRLQAVEQAFMSMSPMPGCVPLDGVVEGPPRPYDIQTMPSSGMFDMALEEASSGGYNTTFSPPHPAFDDFAHFGELPVPTLSVPSQQVANDDTETDNDDTTLTATDVVNTVKTMTPKDVARLSVQELTAMLNALGETYRKPKTAAVELLQKAVAKRSGTA